ncbi:MAG: hypothetical protein AAB565_00880, partial [Patescibacteria group bacterium]
MIQKNSSEKYFSIFLRKVQKYCFASVILGIFIFLPVIVASSLVDKLLPETIEIYPSQLNDSSGWFNVEKVLGPPDVLTDGDLNIFSELNSAIYKEGSLSLIISSFDQTEVDFTKEKEVEEIKPKEISDEEKTTPEKTTPEKTTPEMTTEELIEKSEPEQEKENKIEWEKNLEKQQEEGVQEQAQEEEQKLKEEKKSEEDLILKNEYSFLEESKNFLANKKTKFLGEVKNLFVDLINKRVLAKNSIAFNEAQDFDFESAKIKFSFAIGEKKSEIPHPTPPVPPVKEEEKIEEDQKSEEPVNEKTNIGDLSGEQPLEIKSQEPVESLKPQEILPSVINIEGESNAWKAFSNFVFEGVYKIKDFFDILVAKTVLIVKAQVEPLLEDNSQPSQEIKNSEADQEIINEENDGASKGEEIIEGGESRIDDEENSEEEEAGENPEIVSDGEDEKTTPDLSDAKIIVWWSLDGINWEILDKISYYPLSNFTNGGYFTHEAPFLKNWKDIKDLKLKFEGMVGGESTFTAYLDSAWVQVSLKENLQKDSDIKSEKHFKSSEFPEFELTKATDEKNRENNILEKIIDFFQPIQNQENLQIGVTLVNQDGEEKSLLREQDFIVQKNQEYKYKFKIQKPQDFAPGVYNTKINFEKDGEIQSMEKGFSWGLIDEVPTPQGEPQYTRQITGEEISIPIGESAFLIVPADKIPDGAKVVIRDLDDEIFSEGPKISQSEGNFQITVDPKESGMKPGRYRLQVIEEEKGSKDQKVIFEKAFFWGVLAFNPDYAVYPLKSRAYLSFAVLDDFGKMICDAGLVAKITNPKGRITYLGTGNGTIKVNEDCYNYDKTNKPDYEADFQPTFEGEYQVEVVARFKDGQRTLKDSFFVDAKIPFYLKRTGPTRTFPLAKYEYLLELDAKENGKYEVIEKVPSAFREVNIESCELQNCQFVIEDLGDIKILKWTFESKKDSINKLVYSFKPPYISPYLYLFGPAKIIFEKELEKELEEEFEKELEEESDEESYFSLNWEEPRNWLIANDAVCNSQDGGGNWNVAAKWSCGNVPGTADSAVITSGNNITVDINTAEVKAVTINSGATLSISSSACAGAACNLKIGNTAADGTGFTNNGTFTANTGKVTIKSDVSMTLFSGTFTGGSALYDLTLNPDPAADRTYTVGVAIDVTNNFLTNPGSALLNDLTVNLSGTTTVTGTLTINGLGCSSADSTASRTFFDTTSTNHALTAGLIDIKSNALNCKITANGSTITLTGTSGTLFTRSGTFTQGTSTVVMNPDAAVTLTSGTITFNNLTLSPTITVARTYTFGSGALTIDGNFNINPTASSALALTVNMGAAITVAATKTTTITRTTSATSNLDTTGTNYALSTGNLDIATGGTLTANGSTVTLTGTTGTLFTRTGTFTGGTSTVVF